VPAHHSASTSAMALFFAFVVTCGAQLAAGEPEADPRAAGLYENREGEAATLGCDWCPGSWPYCTREAERVAADAPMLSVSMKWCGLNEAPSIDDPLALMCTEDGVDDFKTYLWRRHERASECIYIPQCHVTLRSGGTVDKSDYERFADLDTTTFEPGDVNNVDAGGMVDLTDEFDQTLDACDDRWSDQPKGVIAVSVRRMFNGGNEIRGLAYPGSITRPFMMVPDTTTAQLNCRTNERSVAHEAGHVLNLDHTCTDNLMKGPTNDEPSCPGGNFANLTLAQCNTIRSYIADNTILDPPTAGTASRLPVLDFLKDRRGGGPPFNFLRIADIYKVVVTDDSATGGHLRIHIGTNGLPFVGTVDYYVALDRDNNPSTGGNGSALIGPGAVGGVEHIIHVTLSNNEFVTTVNAEMFAGERDVWTMLPNVRVLARSHDVHLIGEAILPRPAFTEISLTINRAFFAALGWGTDGRVFPRGLRMQAFGMDRERRYTDPVPGSNEARVLTLPEIEFPGIFAPAEVCRGQMMQVVVDGMSPNLRLGVFFGGLMRDPGVSSDAAGHAQFRLNVPTDMPFGENLLTVGINDPRAPNNAVTADTTVRVVIDQDDCDRDGVCDAGDNCLGAMNAEQCDSDGDGIGNRCDPDFNNDGVVGIPDFNIFRACFGRLAGQPGFDPRCDLDCDGAVGIPDFNIFRSFFGRAPGSACP